MQIEVIDAGSTKEDPEELVKQVGHGRVSFSRIATNRGPAHTFNTCIQRSRGRWVHILHDDDLVIPGFYEAYAAVIRAHPQARTVLGPVVTIDESDRWNRVIGPDPPIDDGVVLDFVERLVGDQFQVQSPSVVVHRDAYERTGGFCTLFDRITDWDMWFRLGQLAPVACVSRPYALYRVHGASETSRLMVSGDNNREDYFFAVITDLRLNRSGAHAGEPACRARLAAGAEGTAWRLDSRGCTEGRYNQARWAWMLEPTMRRFLMLAKSWLKYKLKGKPFHVPARERLHLQRTGDAG
jgi:glycosyltransferase involved in cell wall biosynthesis